MPLNVTNYVLTRTILDNAVGEEPTEGQKADIGRYSAVAALAIAAHVRRCGWYRCVGCLWTTVTTEVGMGRSAS